MFKKLKNNNYNWTFHYIKEYNQMVSFYEKQLNEKNKEIKKLNNELDKLKSNNKFKNKQKQISDEDIYKIKQLKKQGKSYSYISSVTGWSKATISRVINNKNNIY
ncbi:helix-turn-helix domain-containing protein [Paraclostridium sordellii]|uniref:helix-turn-helix domain-containing protein n=1 Tax=Paraclostridium sordellii TaxID=1505 RepID=UPI0005E9271B|nr:helix-turn-helix domain-containing protein [Paeniclostridium sordellii]CEN77465.1 DNA-binding protein [[Clostridium] sordellii] [Paeniclostridium sordellii]